MTYYQALAGALAENRPVVLGTVLAAGAKGLRGAKLLLDGEGSLLLATEGAEYLADGFRAAARGAMAGGAAGSTRIGAGEEWAEILLEPLLPPPEMVICGAGHIAKALVPLALEVGFKVTVIDDRPQYASAELFTGCRVICDDFLRALGGLPLHLASYVVIVTRGHRFDRECLEAVLPRAFAYLGMIGSRRRIRAVRAEMLEKGYSPEQLGRVAAPIGLDLGAETPAEIAVATMAEVIHCRRRGGPSPLSLSEEARSGQAFPVRKGRGAEPEREILVEALEAAQRGERAVLATVARAGGSTPREAGSKMLIYADGRTSGTIGGGCGEAEARREALLALAEGKPRLYRVDLRADLEAEEGMVCGGEMEVFLEPLF